MRPLIRIAALCALFTGCLPAAESTDPPAELSWSADKADNPNLVELRCGERGAVNVVGPRPGVLVFEAPAHGAYRLAVDGQRTVHVGLYRERSRRPIDWARCAGGPCVEAELAAGTYAVGVFGGRGIYQVELICAAESGDGLLDQARAGEVRVDDAEALLEMARRLEASDAELPGGVRIVHADTEIVGAFADAGAFARWLQIELALGPAAPAVDTDDPAALVDRVLELQGGDGRTLIDALIGQPLDYQAACLELHRAPAELNPEPLFEALHVDEAAEALIFNHPEVAGCAVLFADGLLFGLALSVPGRNPAPGVAGATRWLIPQLTLRLGERTVHLRDVRIFVYPDGRVALRSADGRFEAEGDSDPDGDHLRVQLRGLLQGEAGVFQIEGAFELIDAVLRGEFGWYLDGEAPDEGQGSGEGEAKPDCCRVDAITVTRNGGSHAAYGYAFRAEVKVTGRDLTKCEIRQRARVSEKNTEYNGAATPNATILKGYEKGLHGGINTGVFVTDTGWDWAALPHDTKSELTDSQVHNVENRPGTLPGNVGYTQVQLNETTREFKLEIRWGKKVIATHDWKYTWKNTAAKLAGQPYAGAHVSLGVFSGIAGITGLAKLN